MPVMIQTPVQQSVICPFCLDRTAISGAPPMCRSCGQELPPLYLDAGQSMQPLPIQLFGLSRHGKTTFLTALTMALRRVNALWQGCTAMAATESSRQIVRDVNVYFDTGKMPPMTALGAKDCYLMLIDHMIPWGRRALMVRDCSGEAFRELVVNVEEAYFFLKSPFTFMFISLLDLRNSGGYSMDLMLDSYLNTLASNGVRLGKERRKVVIVLTKADLFLLQDDFPQELSDYLRKDPFRSLLSEEGDVQWQTLGDMKSYMQEMAAMSRKIEAWICRRAEGRTLVALARDRNVEIQFSLVSSTGSPPEEKGNILTTGWAPIRILDPFFWTLELESRRSAELSSRL
jgi:hypothetical protein